MNVLILLAALATATNAIAAPRPQITPPPLVGRQAPGNPPGNDLGDPGEYTATDLGPENSILTYEGNTYHVSAPLLFPFIKQCETYLPIVH